MLLHYIVPFHLIPSNDISRLCKHDKETGRQM